MIRKDVKLGFAIGGVLLAVLVVYVMVGSDSKKPNGATIADGEKSDLIDVKGTSLEPITPSKTDKPDSAKVDLAKNDSKNDLGKADATKPDAGKTDAAKSGPDDKSAVASATPGKPDANGELWDSTLNKGSLADQPVMMSTTPGVGGAADRASNESTVKDAKSPVTPVTPVQPKESEAGLVPISREPSNASKSTGSDSSKETAKPGDSSTPVTPAPGSRTHVVQKGETLAKIAAVAYGNSNYYPHILRANPGLDPTKLKPGTTINLPATDDMVAKAKPAAPESTTLPPSASAVKTVASEAPVDTKTQYRVEAGDSLYRISMKLYGTGTLVEKIYDANKETIGADRAKLKLHQLLKLPEPPTQVVSR